MHLGLTFIRGTDISQVSTLPPLIEKHGISSVTLALCHWAPCCISLFEECVGFKAGDWASSLEGAELGRA